MMKTLTTSQLESEREILWSKYEKLDAASKGTESVYHMNTYSAMRDKVYSDIQVLTDEIEKRSAALEVKTSPKISIESLSVMGDDVIVIYLANENWFDATLSLSRLREFARNMGFNEYCEDVVSIGEIVQYTGSFDFDTWFTESLDYVAAQWLCIYHVENPFEAITYKLGELIEELNK